jgi:hypothetical protein
MGGDEVERGGANFDIQEQFFEIAKREEDRPDAKPEVTSGLQPLIRVGKPALKVINRRKLSIQIRLPEVEIKVQVPDINIKLRAIKTPTTVSKREQLQGVNNAIEAKDIVTVAYNMSEE